MPSSISVLTKESHKAASPQQRRGRGAPVSTGSIAERWFPFKRQLATRARGRFTTWKVRWGARERNEYRPTVVVAGVESVCQAPGMIWGPCREIVVITSQDKKQGACVQLCFVPATARAFTNVISHLIFIPTVGSQLSSSRATPWGPGNRTVALQGWGGNRSLPVPKACYDEFDKEISSKLDWWGGRKQ